VIYEKDTYNRRLKILLEEEKRWSEQEGREALILHFGFISGIFGSALLAAVCFQLRIYY
jgi:hypothetical protein